MIFVGEQTSCTHGWIASALESGIRGGVQLLLGAAPVTLKRTMQDIDVRHTELGLVDEAKAAVDKWMARWIEVVSPDPRRKFPILHDMVCRLTSDSSDAW